MQRRTFMQGCCAGIIAMSGARLGNMVFAQPGNNRRDVVINVFLRGGIDALNFLVPYADTHYQDARASHLALGDSQVIDLDGYFGLHPSAERLKEIYDQQHLALIGATGIPDAQGTRSHFQAQDFLDHGGGQINDSGWLGRYLNSTNSADAFGGVFRGLSFDPSVALSLSGYGNALAVNSVSEFTLRGSSSHKDDLRRALRTMYNFDERLGATALKTLDVADLLDANPIGDYVPAPGVEYENNNFARALSSLAQLIKMDLGLQAATVDLGGWDTHENQASGNRVDGGFSDLVRTLCNGLHAFWGDMADHHGHLTVVVMSEFGRRLKENANRGTDHGHGGMMMVLNPYVAQKKVFGPWPGLSNDQLYERKDLRVTTDFRTVLAEVFIKRLGIPESQVPNFFPGYTAAPVLNFLNQAVELKQPSGMALY